MYNIYELVDNICTKVKYHIKCEEAATRILASVEHQKWTSRDFIFTSRPTNTEYMRQAIRDRRRLRSCAAIEAFLWCHENYPEELKAKFTKELKM